MTPVERVEPYARLEVDQLGQFFLGASHVLNGARVPAHARGLQRDQDETGAPLEEELRVGEHDLDLVGLRDVRVHPLDRRHERAVGRGLTRVAQDGEQVGPAFGQREQARERP